MSDWPKIEIADLIKDGSIMIHKDGNHGSNYPRSDEFVAEGYPFLTAKSLNDGRVDLVGAPRLAESKAATFRFGFVRTGDVLLSHNATVGRVAIMPDFDGEAVIGTSLTQYRVDPDKLLPEFLAYYFGSVEFQNNLSFVMSQTTRNQVPITHQRKLTIRRPDIKIQEKIVSVIKPLQEKIDLNRRMSATLEDMARSLYRSWFVDFDPVHAKMEGRQPAFMDEATAALFPDRFGEDGLPEGWKHSEIGNHCDHVKRTVKPMENSGELFQHFSLPAFDDGGRPVIETGADIKSNKAFVPNNAILFSRLNPHIPRVWWARTDQSIGMPAASTEFFVASAMSDEQTPWLYCVMSSDDFRDAAKARITGTSNSHQRVKPDALKEIALIWPGRELVEAFGAVTYPWFGKVQAMSDENLTLASLRDSLLPKLMSGELRVGEAREQVEEVA